MTVNMIPGPFNLALSSYIEWSGETGCILTARCYARLDPRDDAQNLVRQELLIREGEYNFVLKGPVNSEAIVPTSKMFHYLTQASIDPFEYYIGLDFSHSGL